MKKILYAISFIIFLNSNGIAQLQIYLEPNIGSQLIFCRYQNKQEKQDFIKINSMHSFLLSYGLLLKFKNNNFEYLTGIIHEEIGGSVSITMPKQHSNNPNETIIKSEESSVSMLQFPIGFNYTYKTIPLKTSYLNLSIGTDLRLLYVPDIYEEPDIDVGLINMGDTINMSSKSYYNSFGSTITTTLSFDLCRKFDSKKRLSLMVYWEIGLRNVFFYDIDYQINSYYGNITVVSRGTNIGFRVGFPINLNKNSQKNALNTL
jgi:hypothetical protein